MDRSDVMFLLLSMISWRKQSVPYRLLAFVIGNDAGNALGTVLSEREASTWTGLSRNSVYAGFVALVEHNVLLRFDGAGSRGHSFRRNPNLRDWLVPWLNEHEPKPGESPSRDWLAKQEIALGRIHRLLHPELMQKPGFVAHPSGAQTDLAARPSGAQNPPTRAPERATNGPLAARTSARQMRGDDSAHTIPSSNSSISLPEQLPEAQAREGARLIAAIRERTGGAHIVGRLRDEIFALACDTETTDRLVKIVRDAPPSRYIEGWIARCRDELAAPPAPPPAATVFWEPPDTSDKAPPPWRATGGEPTDWIRTDAPTCETDPGGGAP